MNTTRSRILLLITLVLSAIGGCARDDAPAARTAAQSPTQAAAVTDAAPVGASAGAGAAPAQQPAGQAGELSGTAWRLVQIMSMDDTTHLPDDPARYTLRFSSDGAAQVQADCNLGTGSWSSAGSGQLEFGVVAATRAECPPGSLHDRYLAQFQWVRSYVLRDGHLFLATMADGSIIEFEPLAVAP